MAVNEVISSLVPTQPAARTPKLRIYETLFRLNQSFDEVARILRSMMKFLAAHKDSLQCAQDEIEEVRAGVNADGIETLGDRERHDEGRFWKRRRAYEKRLEDPDDVYIDVQHREHERKKQGLPPRVGVVPHAAVADEQPCADPQTANRAKKRPFNSRGRSERGRNK
jgi:hypothetical protein